MTTLSFQGLSLYFYGIAGESLSEGSSKVASVRAAGGWLFKKLANLGSIASETLKMGVASAAIASTQMAIAEGYKGFSKGWTGLRAFKCFSGAMAAVGSFLTDPMMLSEAVDVISVGSITFYLTKGAYESCRDGKYLEALAKTLIAAGMAGAAVLI